MFKKLVLTLVLFFLIFSFSASALESTYVPIRQTFENLGYFVDWNSHKRQVILENYNKKIELIIDNNKYYINNQKNYTEKSPVILNNTAYISAQTLLEIGYLLVQDKAVPINTSNKDILYSHIINFSLRDRIAGSYGETLSAEYINKQFEILGYDSTFQIFNYREFGKTINKSSQNIIANKKSSNNNAKTIIIGAHYDSYTLSPAAYDNASGISVLLELARLLSEIDTSLNIRFIAFGAEEPGMFGSFNYVNSLSNIEKENIIGMINIDMLGTRNKDLNIYTIDGEDNYLTSSFKTISHENNITYKNSKSDHISFYRANIPIILFSCGETEYMHTHNDTIGKIDFDSLEKITDKLLKFIIMITLKQYA